MKYLTKEHYAKSVLACANYHTKKSKYAERKDEGFYNRTYNKKYNLFAANEKSFEAFKDVPPREEVDRYIEELKTEREVNVNTDDIMAFFEHIHEYYLLHSERYRFNEEVCKRKFEHRQEMLIKTFSCLPQAITEKIADMRVFALGYASAEVKMLLSPYCADLKRKLRQTEKEAAAETDRALKYLNHELDLDLEDMSLFKIKIINSDVHLITDCENRIIVKHGEIIEGAGHIIFPNDDAIDRSSSCIMSVELHRNDDGKFELHLLIVNEDTMERKETWYLTICGTDVIY